VPASTAAVFVHLPYGCFVIPSSSTTGAVADLAVRDTDVGGLDDSFRAAATRVTTWKLRNAMALSRL
jgi:hypothetical protein